MKALLVTIAALLSLAFVVQVSETPAQRKEREAGERRWNETLNRYYNLSALRIFLQKEIEKQKLCEGVDLAKANIADAWRIETRMAFCGDWRLVLNEPHADAFRLVWGYEYVPPKGDDDGLQKSIVIECQRLDRDRFQLKSIQRLKDKLVILLK